MYVYKKNIFILDMQVHKCILALDSFFSLLIHLDFIETNGRLQDFYRSDA